MLKLNLGCGFHTPIGWLNVDYAIGAWLAKPGVFATINKKFKIINLNWSNDIFLCDLTKKLPWDDDSVDIIYSSHSLEHLSKIEGRYLLRECQRLLKPNGIIQIVVPDLKVIINRYTQEKIAADEVLDQLYVTYNSPTDGVLMRIIAPFIQFPHKCMYDTSTLLRIMSEIGFEVAIKQAFESEIKDIQVIEQSERTAESILVEGKKISAYACK